VIRISIRFVAGRFHATPWSHHVNEGVPEWPPSPWRLLRALVSTLHTRGSDLPFDVTYAAILRLAAAPRFVLPAASAAHSRHYLSLNELDRAKTTLTLDTFVSVDPADELIVAWDDVALSEVERAALSGLVERVAYLGRAESWCSIRLLADERDQDPSCWPSDGRSAPGREIVRVLCPAEDVSREDLERTTRELQEDGWSDPPGSRWLFYSRPSCALRSAFLGAAAVDSADAGRPDVIILALGRARGADGSRGPMLPRVVDAVRVMEAVRAAALSLHRDPSAVLSGRDLARGRLDDQHGHAHYFAECLDPDAPQRITHVVVWAPSGFSAAEEAAVGAITYLRWPPDGSATMGLPAADGRIEVAFLGAWALHAEAGNAGGSGRPDFGSSLVWRSQTPFVAPRHPKRGRDTVPAQVNRELAFRGLPPARVEPYQPTATEAPAPLDSVLARRGRRYPTTPVLGLRLTFDTHVSGPLLLGLLSHYGLGRFVPE